MGIQIEAISCFKDNYAYLVSHVTAEGLALVDASEAAPILKTLGERTLCHVFSTHHHMDHVSGHALLMERFPKLDIYAYKESRGTILGQNHFLDEGEEVLIGMLKFRALHVPGHTLHSMAYLLGEKGKEPEAVFTGDSLFLGGCGRLFEGTGDMMYASLLRFKALPPTLAVYSGHEYTENNLRFGAMIEPDNVQIQERLRLVEARQGEPSKGSIQDELETNVFLRCHLESVKIGAGTEGQSEVETFVALRKMKDKF